MARFRGFVCDVCGEMVDPKQVTTISAFDSNGTICKVDMDRIRYDVCPNCKDEVFDRLRWAMGKKEVEQEDPMAEEVDERDDQD